MGPWQREYADSQFLGYPDTRYTHRATLRPANNLVFIGVPKTPPISAHNITVITVPTEGTAASSIGLICSRNMAVSPFHRTTIFFSIFAVFILCFSFRVEIMFRGRAENLPVTARSKT